MLAERGMILRQGTVVDATGVCQLLPKRRTLLIIDPPIYLVEVMAVVDCLMDYPRYINSDDDKHLVA